MEGKREAVGLLVLCFLITYSNGQGTAAEIVLHPDSEISSEYGLGVSLACVAYGFPLPAISWFRDGIIITNSTQDAIILEGVTEEDSLNFTHSILEICPLRIGGNYSCEASNDNGTDAFYFQVNVDEVIPAEIVLHPDPEITADYDSGLSLTCVVYGSPPLDITWLRHGSLVSNSTLNATIIETTIEEDNITFTVSMLELCPLRIGGNYSCAASNDNGTDITYFQVIVVQDIPAEVYIHPGTEILVDSGSGLSITCVGYGSPAPNITWYRDDSVIDNSTSNDTNIIEIPLLVEEDRLFFTHSILELCPIHDGGNFSCVASNGFNNSHAFDFVITVIQNSPPEIIFGNLTVNVTEDAVIGTGIAVVVAVDDQSGPLSYNITGGSGSDFFTITPQGAFGLVTLSQALDREFINVLTLEVVAVDDSFLTSSPAYITVHVLDVNDNAPIFVMSSYRFYVNESAPIGTVIGQVLALDPDMGVNSAIEYILLTPSASFAVNDSNGEIYIIEQIDLNLGQQQQIVIAASDPTLSSSVNVTISVLLSDAPEIVSGNQTLNVSENVPEGTFVASVVATINRPRPLRYNITRGNQFSLFNISEDSGVITISQPPDRETVNVVILEVVATDGVQTSLPVFLTVHILDVNDNGPIFSSSLYSFEVNETTLDGTVIGQVQAVDGDAIPGEVNPNGEIEYSLQSPSVSFGVNGSTGEIYTTAALDQSLGHLQQIVIVARDFGVNSLSSVAMVAVSVLSNCGDGALRLVNGATQLEGRVEICFSGVWGTVCDDFWGTSDAGVVCRELGYLDTGAIAHYRAQFGRGTGTIWLDNVQCQGSELRLRDCPANQLGQHNCLHSEDAGVTCFSSPPPSPPNITATPNVTEILLEWTHPPNDIIENYTINWSYLGPCLGLTNVSAMLDGSERSFTLISLRPNSEYLFRLEAINDAGTSVSFIIVETLFEAPDVDAIFVGGGTIIDVTETSLGIRWEPVACFQHYNLPLTVRITLSQLSTGLRVGTATVSHDSGDYTFTGLQPGTEHVFQLNVTFQGNVARTGITVRATTLQVSVPPISPSLTATASNTRVTLHWSQLPIDAIQNYTLSWAYQGPCSGPGTPSNASQILNASSTSFNLTNLISGSVYLVRLQARNKAGTAESQITVNTSYEAPVVEVANLRVTSVSETTIEVSWMPVECLLRANMPILVRIITRELPSQSIVAAVTRPDSGTYMQTGLSPGSSYSFQVLAAGGTSGPTITAITSAPVLVVCEEETDTEWRYFWPETLAGLAFSQPCLMGNTQGQEARRLCLSTGEWGAVNTSNCRRRIFDQINMESDMVFLGNSTPSYEAVEMLVSNLTVVTSAETTGNSSHFPSDLNTTNAVVTRVVDFLLESSEQADPNSLLPFNEELINVFNNLLEEDNEDGWEQLQMEESNLGSTVLLQNVENYAVYVGNAIVNENIDTGDRTTIMLPRTNIVLDAVAIPQNVSEIDSVYFPDLEGDKEREFGNAPAQARIPANLLIERGANESNVTTVNVLFTNLEQILPPIGNATVAASQIISSQIISGFGKGTTDSFPVEFYFETNLYNKSLYELENPRCAFIVQHLVRDGNMSGEQLWSVDGIEEVFVELVEEGDFIYYKIRCRSFHLTSFAVLMDVYGISKEIPPDEAFALTVVTYVGCAISIFFLLASIVLLLSLGKELFTSVHYFIHLNLSIALVLGYLLFVTGVDNAVGVKGVCTAVAALLHYLFTAVFCWMLCEGIMLYLMLVVVFSSLAKKWWLFLLIGWVLPIFPVAVSVGTMHDKYGSEENCWLVVEDPSSVVIWLFVGPMLAIILLNTFFLVASLRSLYKVRRAKIGGKKIVLFWKVFLASIFLLPLLGLTWLFGLLAINNSLTAFTWIFTILNSLQGVFIFIFQVIRNDKLMKRFCKKTKKPSSSSVKSTKTSHLKKSGFSSSDYHSRPSNRVLRANPVSVASVDGLVLSNIGSPNDDDEGLLD